MIDSDCLSELGGHKTFFPALQVQLCFPCCLASTAWMTGAVVSSQSFPSLCFTVDPVTFLSWSAACTFRSNKTAIQVPVCSNERTIPLHIMKSFQKFVLLGGSGRVSRAAGFTVWLKCLGRSCPEVWHDSSFNFHPGKWSTGSIVHVCLSLKVYLDVAPCWW